MVTYWKAFDPTSTRIDLKPNRIYEAGLPREAFERFKQLRNKAIAHDDGDFTTDVVGAVIGPSEERNVERILYMHAFAVHLSDSEVTNLGLLIEHALRWVVSEFDRRADELADSLRESSYADLLALPDATIDKPSQVYGKTE